MKSSKRDSMLCEVANMYYNKGMTQAEIARAMYISRTSISRLLQTARESGLVEIKIHYNSERCYYLEEILCEQLGLKEAYVYDFGSAEREPALSALCKRVADYLIAHMDECSVFGVSRGTVMSRVLDAIPPSEIQHDIKLVQMHGCESTSESSSSSEDLMRRMLALCGGTGYYLNAPLYLKSCSLREELENEPSICRTMKLIEKVDTVVTGIGALTENWRETSFLAEYLDEATIQKLISLACVGHIFGQFFDIHGKQIDHPINSRCLGVRFCDIPKIPRVIAAVFGADRAPACLGALRGHLASILFTDRTCAERVLELNHNDKHPFPPSE